MKVYQRDAGERHVSFRGLPVMDVLQANRVPAVYTALSGFNVRRERAADVRAMFEEAGHHVVDLRGAP